MCGLTAFLALSGGPNCPGSEDASKEAPDLRSQVGESLDLIKHRGPDARGHWFSGDRRVGLGHVRLSIIDLSPAGNQPFHNTDDTIHAVVNGELYDDERIRTELATEYKFKSQCDCEVVIALYQRYGESFLSHLRGEFALVLWDAKRKLFIAARDRYGIKSLYYTVVDGRLLVATEMKSFLPFGWRPEWDVVSLQEKGWMYGPGMFFKGVYRVRPGQYLVSRGFNEGEVRTYWDLDYPCKHDAYPESEADTVARVRELLLESVQLRLRADVGVGVFLSGGLDSSAIAGMTAHIMQQGESLGDDSSGNISRLSCFTVQFDKDSGFDESDIAQRTAQWLGVDFRPVHLDEETIASRLEDTVWHTETPIPDVNGMGRLALAEAAHAAGKRVILTGEGSDEHFAGYGDFLWSYLLEPDYSWASTSASDAAISQTTEMWKAADEMVARGVAGTVIKSTDANAAEKLNQSSIFPRIEWVYQIPFAEWTYKPKPKPKPNSNSNSNATTTPSAPETSFAESFSSKVLANITQKWHPLNSSQYQWTKSVLANYILRYLGDNIDMVYQIETRTPFLDHHLTKYVNTIPPSLKIKYDPVKRNFREKYILREAMRPFITDEVYERMKQPYIGPTRYRKGGAVHGILERLVTERNVQGLGFLDWPRVRENLVKAFGDGNGDGDGDPVYFRSSLVVAQLVVLGRRFGVKTVEGFEKEEEEEEGGVTSRLRGCL
ncbi:asparagine synthetase [Aspergillus heteromorphus CBS 117.55]|uniref:Asparagine synthetase n=1 Tax=Aspergillus heteromorphus CBS 117.55 TaxID=1448321 RepID=A0A317WA73_9EURO|nr:asparagine synthetase [Aspergillus heteromorphus CBS 117.55]PWY83434.1 asparagine synthetase [Aspergillus heteromorphus CBS 117.55]